MDIVTYALCKNLINKTLAGAGALAGKSAYEVAVENGFSGSETEWLESLKGSTPYIGENGNWFIDGQDTNQPATSATKITSVQNSTELIFDEINGTISSIVGGNSIVVANYSDTAPIEDIDIEGLFNKE